MMYQDILYLRRLDFVTASYSELGALRLVPVGLFAVLMATLVGGWVELSAFWYEMAAGWGVGVTILAFFLVSLWYRNNYGMTLESWPGSKREAWRWALVWGGAAATVAAAVAGFGAVMELLGSLAGVAVVVWMLVYWRRTGSMWPHAYALTSLLMVGSLLHQTALADYYSASLLGLIGVTLVIVGIVDHRRLAKEAKPLEEDNDE